MNILHLSDIHFGRNYPEYRTAGSFQAHDAILDELLALLSATDELSRPEHVVFTGDIAWRGKRKEYQEALVWFRKLLDILHLTPKDISFCVGNHDVDTACIPLHPELNDNTVDEIDEIYRYENAEIMASALDGYNDFCKELGVIPYAYPVNGQKHYSYSMGYKDVTFSNGKTIRLIALNTSLLYGQSGISSDKMWLGHEQITTLMDYGILPVKDEYYTVALFHHASRFLHPNEISSYDKRSASLPLLMDCVHLALCGHTESTGRPVISRQLGGGNILCGGAVYYDDQHNNAFSYIYIDAEKKSMVFFPYEYNNGWKEYNFENSDIYKASGRGKTLAEEPVFFDANLILNFTDSSYMIPIGILSGNNIAAIPSACNEKDFMNPFLIQSDADSILRICMRAEKKRSSDALLEYGKLLKFAESHTGTTCCITDAEGRSLFSFPGFSIETLSVVDWALLNDIKYIEESFNVSFSLPDAVSPEDRKKLEILKDIAEHRYADQMIPIQSIEEPMSKEELQAIYDAALLSNSFCIKSEKQHRMTLLGTRIRLGKVTLLSAPFHVDLEDLKYKLDTCRNGDTRQCLFCAGADLHTYIRNDVAPQGEDEALLQGRHLYELKKPDFQFGI